MGRVATIKPNDTANGEGVVVSVWYQGCPHHCKGCFNKETWDYNGGEFFSDIHIKKVIESIKKNGVNRNLSILGGESLCEQNREDVLRLCEEVKKEYPKIKIYLWSGYLYEEIITFGLGKDILKNIDILIDGKFEEDKKDISLKMRGSTNQRIIDVKESLKENKVILYNK